MTRTNSVHGAPRIPESPQAPSGPTAGPTASGVPAQASAATAPLTAASGFTPKEVAHGTFEVKGKDGVALHTRYWKPAGSKPRGVFVISHGLRSHGGRYDGVAREMAQRGWLVVAPDHRGHGLSGGKKVDVARFDDYVDDLSAVYDAAKKQAPGAPVVMFGHSMGGQIATRFALDHKDALAGLVLAAPALGAPSSPTDKVKAGAARALSWFGTNVGWPRTDQLRVFALDNGDFSRDPKVVASMNADPHIYGNGTARLADELLGAIDDTQARAGELTVPLLTMHGGADTVTEARASEAFTRSAKNSDARFQLFPEHAHDLLHDLDSGPVREALFAQADRWIARG